MQSNVVRLQDSEQSLWLESLRQHNRSQIPLITLFCLLSLQTDPRLAHLRWPCMVMTLTNTAAFLIKQRAVGHIEQATSDAQIRQHAHAAELLCVCVRLAAHISNIILDTSDGIFLKMVSIIWMPVATAKSTCHHDTFKVFLVVQTILVLYRFSDNWEAGSMWIVSSVIMSRYLIDWTAQEQEARHWRDELKFALARLEGIAEETTKNLFHRFCDATANFKDSYELSEPAPRLGAMLNIHQTQGRSFTSLVENSDVQRFIDHMERVKQQSKEQRGTDTKDVQLDDYIQVNLMDSFAKPVPVHLFITCFYGMDGKATHFMGISESWRPPKIKHKKEKGQGRLGTSSNLESEDFKQDLSPTLSPASSGVSAAEKEKERQDKESPSASLLPPFLSKSPTKAVPRRYSPRPTADRKPSPMPGDRRPLSPRPERRTSQEDLPIFSRKTSD